MNHLIGLRNEPSEQVGDYVKKYLNWNDELKAIK